MVVVLPASMMEIPMCGSAQSGVLRDMVMGQLDKSNPNGLVGTRSVRVTRFSGEKLKA